MLFNPPSIPTSSTYKILSNIDLKRTEKEVLAKLTSIESLRYQFWQQLSQMMNNPKKLQNPKFWMEKKAYLYETINLLDYMSSYGNIYCGFKYWSVLGNELGLSPIHITFESSGESVATVELILSRYAYSFSLLASQLDRYSLFLIYKNNIPAIVDKTKEIMIDVEDATIRLAKFNKSKKLIWAGLDNATVQKYKHFLELNFMLVEPFYLIFEVVFANLMTFKILLSNNENAKHCSLVSSVVGYALSKLLAIETSFNSYPNSFSSHVLKWAEEARTLLKFHRLMSCYILNKILELNPIALRNKVYEQIYHENFILGKEIATYFESSNSGIEIAIFKEKYEGSVYKDISKYGHLVDDIKPEYKKITIADIMYDKNLTNIPDTVRNMINGKAEF